MSSFNVIIPPTAEHAAVSLLETVSKYTIIMPSQKGCATKCTFCVSSSQKAQGNLSVDLMDQLMQQALNACTADKPIELSFTGEGEPLMNIHACQQVVDIHRERIQSVRFSTSGLGCVKNLPFVIRSKPQRLQLSIHNPFDDERKQQIPHGDSVEDMINAVKANIKKFDEVVINVVLQDGWNSSKRHANAIADLCDRAWFVTVSPALGSVLAARNQAEYVSVLRNRGINVRVFSEVGKQIRENDSFSLFTYLPT